MPARRQVDVRVLRVAAQAAVNGTSLRGVARRVGTSAQGLTLFLNGATPREAMLRKLREWYFTEIATSTSLDADGACAVIQLFLESLAEGARPRVFRRVIHEIHAAHRKHGSTPPDWLIELLGRESP